MADIVERLRQVSLDKSSEAWRRIDGGQDLSIGSMLADEAADEIERLREALRKVAEGASDFGTRNCANSALGR